MTLTTSRKMLLGAPVMLQMTPSTVRYAGLYYYCALARAAAESIRTPVAHHLDHGDGFVLAILVLRAVYTSIMIDGSRLPFGRISR